MWPPRNPPPTKPSRSDRQRPGETAAGERKRGRRYGADVPTLTGPDLVLTMWGASCPDGGAVDGGPRRASGARASAAVGAMAVLVPTKPVQPLTPPRRGASSRTYDPPAVTPQPSPTRPPRQRPPATRRPRPASQRRPVDRKNQPPLFPPDPLQKSEKKVKDNLKWRIN